MIEKTITLIPTQTFVLDETATLEDMSTIPVLDGDVSVLDNFSEYELKAEVNGTTLDATWYGGRFVAMLSNTDAFMVVPVDGKLYAGVGNVVTSEITQGTYTVALKAIVSVEIKKVHALKAFVYEDYWGLHSVAHGEVVEIESTLANTFISEGLAEAYTLITPSGTKSITENGTHDVTEFASASVSVAFSISRMTVRIGNTTGRPLVLFNYVNFSSGLDPAYKTQSASIPSGSGSMPFDVPSEYRNGTPTNKYNFYFVIQSEDAGLVASGDNATVNLVYMGTGDETGISGGSFHEYLLCANGDDGSVINISKP